MCQLIAKPADYTLPMNLLTSTCMVNADGWGVMTHKDNKLILAKSYTRDNDPEEIMEVLENLHDTELFLHFRYRTKGVINTESCHPFLIYDDYDRQLGLMHNGTLTGYGSLDTVDSLDFGLQIVGPLYGTFLKSGVRKPLEDALFKKTVTKFTDSSSKIALLDNLGSQLIINPNAGEMYEDKDAQKKFWISNSYSFNRFHRGGTSNSATNFPRSQTGMGVITGGTTTGTNTFSPPKTSSNVVPIGEANSNRQTSIINNRSGLLDDTEYMAFWETNLPSVDADESWKEEGEKRRKEEETKKQVGLLPKREKLLSYYKDILKLDEIDELLDMTMEDIEELVDIEPEHAKLLIKDLMLEIYLIKYEQYQDDDAPSEEFIDPLEDTEAPFEGPYVREVRSH